MECDTLARLVKLESTIQTLEAKIDDLTRKRTNSAIASKIEDEITELSNVSKGKTAKFSKMCSKYKSCGI